VILVNPGLRLGLPRLERDLRAVRTELAELGAGLVDEVGQDLLQIDAGDLLLFVGQLDLGEHGDEELGLDRDVVRDPKEALEHLRVGERADDLFDLLVEGLELLEDDDVGGATLRGDGQVGPGFG